MIGRQVLVAGMTAFIGLTFAASASAQTTANTWNGLYFGGAIEFIRGTGDTAFDPLPDPATFVSLRPTTVALAHHDVTGRVLAGFNFTHRQFLVGADGDYSFRSLEADGSVSPILRNDGSVFPGTGSLNASQRQQGLVTAKVRAGMIIGPALAYGSIGVAVGHVNYAALADYPARDYAVDYGVNKVGWTAGVGTELRISRVLRTRFEFRAVDLADEVAVGQAVPSDPIRQEIQFTWKTKSYDFSAGLVFRF